MAIQTFQFGIVLAIGFSLASAALNAVAIETSAKLVPSLDLEDPEDVVIARGHPAILHCKASSVKNDHKITWYLNDTLLSEEDGRWHFYKNGSVYIPKVAGKRMNTSLEGSYRCLVSNSDGALISNPARLKIAILKEFTEQPQDINGTDSQPIVIPCSINSYPKAIVTWERDELPLPQDIRYVPLPTGSLLITSIHSSDAGSYRCVVENAILKKKKISRSGRVNVDPRNPKIVIPLTILPIDIDFNVTMLVGNDVALYCIVNGWPRPTIKWLNDKIVIGNSHVLSLKNVSLTASGKYTCMAHNSGGQFVQEYFMSVHKEPRFNFTPISMVYPTAKTIRLDCQALGVPEPQITWYKNGQPFYTNDTFGRAYEQSTGLLISYSVASDAGLYQCLARNSAGTAWMAAMVKLNYSVNSPSPPLDVHCHSFNDTSICLNWNSVPNAQAYSILAYYSGIRLRDYVTNETFKMADNLFRDTNYTFSVRTYSNEASNEFVRVSCRTGNPEMRKLSVKQTSDNSVKLSWSEITSDRNPCVKVTTVTYKIQWRKVNQSSVNMQHVSGHKWIIVGLQPQTTYEFRVHSSTQNEDMTWSKYTLIAMDNATGSGENELDPSYMNETSLVPMAPSFLEATPTSTQSINLTWADVNMADIYYTVCFTSTSENKGCESGKTIKSYKSNIEITRLKPRTVYEFKVQTHTANGLHSNYSYSLQISTPSDLPSSVQSLKYTIVNSTSACVHWEPPLVKNGKLTGYLIKYTPNNSWPLEQWHTLNLYMPQKNKGCWTTLSPQAVSVLLKNLSPNKQYMVIVIAMNDAGPGNPTVPITVNTQHPAKEDEIPPSKDNLYYKQGIGVILGLSLSLVSMVLFITCFLLRRRYLKVFGFPRGRANVANNHCQVSGLAAGSSRQENCSSDTHEMQQLVEGNGAIYIPTHLDTKGGTEFPNGQINGNVKKYYTNGSVPNSHIHITENPQYYSNDKKDELQQLNSYEEDSNSNLQKLNLTKILDQEIIKINNLDRNTMKLHSDCDSSMDSNLDTLLNCTQLTNLDDLIMPDLYRKISPALGPNG